MTFIFLILSQKAAFWLWIDGFFLDFLHAMDAIFLTMYGMINTNYIHVNHDNDCF